MPCRNSRSLSHTLATRSKWSTGLDERLRLGRQEAHQRDCARVQLAARRRHRAQREQLVAHAEHLLERLLEVAAMALEARARSSDATLLVSLVRRTSPCAPRSRHDRVRELGGRGGQKRPSSSRRATARVSRSAFSSGTSG
jgi:hypothetical protein